MDWMMHIHEAFANLFAAKLRSFLAILGVLVGTGAVVALVSSSQLATQHALEQFKTLGTNLVAVMLEPQGSNQQGSQSRIIGPDDIPTLQQKVPAISKIVSYTILYLSIYFADQHFDGQVIGATESLADVVKIDMGEGRFVSFLDKKNFYCVVGSDIGDYIRSRGLNPIGQQIKVGQHLFTIIGVAKPWEPNLFLFAEINKGIIIPLSLSFLIQKNVHISNILIRLKPQSDLNQAKNAITAAIASIAPNEKINFRDPQQIINVIGKQRKTFSFLLSAIGGISLIVGGIGVMNIMLVSVVERRREIGVRMAIGAHRKDILKMFLIESVILTAFGGFIGILTGSLIAFLLAMLSHWEYHFYILPPALGFGVSVLVGILSGIYPSYHASRLDPIETLRSD